MSNLAKRKFDKPSRTKMLYDLFTIITLIFFAKEIIGIFKGNLSNMYVLIIMGGVYIILLAINENLQMPKIQNWLFLVGTIVLFVGLIINIYNIFTNNMYLQSLNYPTVIIFTLYTFISSKYIKETLDDKKKKVNNDKKDAINKNKPKKKKRK